MQFRCTSMSAMLAITKHGVSVGTIAPSLVNFIMADMGAVQKCISAVAEFARQNRTRAIGRFRALTAISDGNHRVANPPALHYIIPHISIERKQGFLLLKIELRLEQLKLTKTATYATFLGRKQPEIRQN